MLPPISQTSLAPSDLFHTRKLPFFMEPSTEYRASVGYEVVLVNSGLKQGYEAPEIRRCNEHSI